MRNNKVVRCPHLVVDIGENQRYCNYSPDSGNCPFTNARNCSKWQRPTDKRLQKFIQER